MKLTLQAVQLCLSGICAGSFRTLQRIVQELLPLACIARSTIDLSEEHHHIGYVSLRPGGLVRGETVAHPGDSVRELAAFGQTPASENGSRSQPVGEALLSGHSRQGFGMRLEVDPVAEKLAKHASAEQDQGQCTVMLELMCSRKRLSSVSECLLRVAEQENRYGKIGLTRQPWIEWIRKIRRDSYDGAVYIE